MNKVGKFGKVSFEQFKKDWIDTFQDENYNPNITNDEILNIYKTIELPTRATNGSAGYDFKSPLDFKLRQNQTIKIPTGIKVIIDDGWVLLCFPRSGLGFKYRLQLDNSTAIIDSDYYCSDNEGHIFVKLTNDCKKDKTLEIKQGDRIIQGIFIPFGITYTDYLDKKEIRNGGLGSTGSN